MSAVAAYWAMDGRSTTPADVARLTAAMAHRGPDGIDHWAAGPMALGHCSLMTTPESERERFPWVDSTGRWIVVADARLDNRDDLQTALKLGGSASDAEILLAGHRVWGDLLPTRMLGDFVFLIWDAQEQTLIGGRDPMGVRALYYFLTPRTFACATELQALRSLPECPRDLNEHHLGDLLARTFEDRVSTCYRDVSRLPAAHGMELTASRLRTWRYWGLDPSRALPPASDEEYAEELHSKFVTAVARRARAARPVGAFLSGGLDSSAIVAVARGSASTLYPAPLRTYYAEFGFESASEDTRYVEAMLGGDTAHHRMMKVDFSPLSESDSLTRQIGEFFWVPNAAVSARLCTLMQGDGIRVVLDGFDGDSAVSHGYAGLTSLVRRGRLLRFAREAPALSRARKEPLTKIVFGRAILPFLPGWARAAQRTLRGRSIPQWDPIIDDAFAQRIALGERTARPDDPGAVHLPLPRSSRADQHLRLASGMFQSALEGFDVLTARRGLQSTYPFFDAPLMEFCLALPDDVKLRNGWNRWIFRKAMAELPNPVRWRRSKANMSPFTHGGILAHHRETLDRLVAMPPVDFRRYIHVRRLAAVWDRYVAAPSAADAMSLLMAAELSIWLNQQAELAGVQDSSS